MQGIYYQKYIKEYRNALELLQNKKKLQQYKEKLEEERKQNFVQLKVLITDLTAVKTHQAELTNIEETIKTKSAQIESTRKDIEIYRDRCNNKQMIIMTYAQNISKFREKFNSEFKLIEKK